MKNAKRFTEMAEFDAKCWLLKLKDRRRKTTLLKCWEGKIKGSEKKAFSTKFSQ